VGRTYVGEDVTIDPAFRDSVRQKYNRIDQIWTDVDRWHARSRREIFEAVDRLNRLHPEPHELVIDIGAGGQPQRVPARTYVQADIAVEKLRGIQNSVCADAHHLPFADGAADCVMCVGAVVNYCSLTDIVAEINRISAPGAMLVMHIELSNSFEFFLTPHYRADAAFIKTFYQGEESLWVYSDRHVRQVLTDARFEIVDTHYFHIASALAYRLLKKPNVAVKLSGLDAMLSAIPRIGGIADSALFICRKAAANGHHS
jgi:hypothetical protein